MKTRDDENMPWKDIQIDDTFAAEQPPKKKNTGFQFPVSIPILPIILTVISVIAAGAAGFLYYRVADLKSDVSVMKDKVVELSAANQKLKDDLADVSRKIESMKAEREAAKLKAQRNAEEEKARKAAQAEAAAKRAAQKTPQKPKPQQKPATRR